MRKHFLILLGTRPEAIKLFPVINRLKAEKDIAVTVCATAQHRQMLDQVLKLAKVVPDFDLNVMTPNQTLAVPGTVSMTTAAADGCQGTTFAIPLIANGRTP